MTPKKANARPKALKAGIKNLIAKRAVENPTYDRTMLAAQLINEIKEVGEIPPTPETTIKYISEFRTKYSVDKPWNTATLSSQPITPEALPWLMRVQSWRKDYYSKPLTTREAKWFNRFFGFRNDISPQRFPETKTDLALKNALTVNVIATWSEFYARKEKIDIISGITEPDYSALDNSIVKGNYQAIFDSYDKAFFDALKAVGKDEAVTKEKLEKFRYKWLEPAMSSQICYFETRWLIHSLGEPDMSPESVGLYGYVLKAISHDQNFEIIGQRMTALSYEQIINFFVLIRFWSKENPGDVKKFRFGSPQTEEDLNGILTTLPKIPEMVFEILDTVDKRKVNK